MEPLSSPYLQEMIKLPLFNSVGCGDFMFADSEVQEMVSIKASLVSKGLKHFILKTVGDSMNKAGVNDGDYILCRKTFTPSEGEKVVALVGDDATLKEFHKTQDSIILRPLSTNPRHQDIIFTEGDDIKIQGVMVKILKDEDIVL
jgi:repressor LexA